MTVDLRQSLGISAGASVSVTLTDLAQITADSPYITALSQILQRFPAHFHLFAGPGEVKRVRARLHADGVLPRVRFMGNMADAEPLLAVCDLYLAYFPGSGPEVERAGSLGKPSVVLGRAETGGPPLQHSAGTVSDYIETASRLIRSSSRAT